MKTNQDEKMKNAVEREQTIPILSQKIIPLLKRLNHMKPNFSHKKSFKLIV
jgi:hypothetical protein